VNPWLLAGGLASGAASIAHLLCLPGGAAAYRRMGAGERMARAVARGEHWPHLVTLGIAAMLALWACWALSGTQVIGRLPLLRPVLVAITTMYLARAAALPVMLRLMPDRSRGFLIGSSLVAFGIGAVHAVGLLTNWREL
jgi:hypothetical protein